MMPIDLPLALAYAVVSGLIPALKTIPPSNSLKHPPAVILSPNSGLPESDVKLLSVEEETVIRWTGKLKIIVQNQ